MTLAVVTVMFLMALVLWIIDLVDLVGEARITLIQNPDVDIGTKYGYATDFVLKRAAVEDIIYAYMVRFRMFCLISRSESDTRRSLETQSSSGEHTRFGRQIVTGNWLWSCLLHCSSARWVLMAHSSLSIL